MTEKNKTARWLRRGVLALLALALLAAAALSGAVLMAHHKMERRVDVDVKPVALRPRSDTAALERGRYLYASRGCVDCHGANGGGRLFIDAPNGLRVAGPQIAPGAANATAAYRPEDWVRAIRHGVDPAGRPLMIMPSEDYNRFTDEDLAALVAHIRALPPVRGTPAVVEMPLPVRALYGFGLIQDAAARIDHRLPPALPVAEGVSVAHGAYVANMCLGCHGPQLAGGKVPGGPPDWPAASRLAPGGDSAMARYPDAESMIRLFRSGLRPDGTPVRVMPFESLREISDTDMRALYLFLRQLPPPRKG